MQTSSTMNPAAPEDFDLWLEAGRTEKHYWMDLWRYRELFLILAWRDVAIRYKQTVAGAAWALLQPFFTMVIMSIVFGRLAGLSGEGGVPYPIMVFAALLPWQFFSNALSTASQSIVGNANLISKVYFPRLIVPASSVVVSAVDFLVSFVILIGLMVWYRFMPGWRMVTLPAFVLLAFLAALNVRFRDFRFVIPFIVQFGLYVSPVGFSSSVVREKFGDLAFMLYSMNPVVGVIDGFRWAILGEGSHLYLPSMVISVAFTFVCLWAGILYFRRTERSFADVI
jgi:lipopolysaccharide transport system permease protein